MKIKVFLISLITLTCSLCLSACHNNQTDDKTGIIEDAFGFNTTASIYSVANQEIGSICFYECLALIDSSVLYTKIPDGVSDPSIELEYRLYDIETGKDNKLGTVIDWFYNEAYETTVVEDHLYMSISTGDIREQAGRKQTIYDFDLTNYSMTPILEIDGGIPYNSFTIADDKLLLAELLESGKTDLVEYDLTAEHGELPFVHGYDDKDIFTSDSIRHISSDETYIYMIRLSQNENDEHTLMNHNENDEYILYMDTYDHDLRLLETVDISDICNPSSFYLREEDIENERKMWVSNFLVRDSYIYYQNFSATTFLGSVNGDTINRFVETDDTFHLALEAESFDANDLFLKTLGDESGDPTNRNLFYLVDQTTGEIQKAEFYADDKRYCFSSAMRNNKDMILLSMDYASTANGEQIPMRMYYLSMDDLEFKPL